MMADAEAVGKDDQENNDQGKTDLGKNDRVGAKNATTEPDQEPMFVGRDLFLERAKTIDPQTQRPTKPRPSPWLGLALTVGAPIAAIVFGYNLLLAINIGKDSAAYSIPRYAAVRTALAQALERDLVTTRLEEILAKTDDASPYVAPAKKANDPKAAQAESDKGKTARAAARTADLKAIAARLNGDRALLAEALTRLAMTPPLNADPIAARLTSEAAKTPVTDTIKNWVSGSLDPWSAAAAKRSVKGDANAVVAAAIQDSLGLTQPMTALKEAMSSRFDGATIRSGDSWWTNDIGARLTWAVVTLLFLMTFAMAAVTSWLQLRKIGGQYWRMLFVVTAVAALIAAVVAEIALSPRSDATPLHRALNDFANQLGVGMVTWSVWVNWLRAIGLVLLIAGSTATFAVKIESLEELTDELRGFKSMFNIGTVFLFTGVLEVYALFRWPIVFAADATTREVLNSAAATLAASIGVLFTVVLLGAYVATTIVIRSQAMACPTIPKEKVDEALEKAGFGDLLSQQGLRLAQALSPLLPGFVTLLK